jgi:hypothetical protein
MKLEELQVIITANQAQFQREIKKVQNELGSLKGVTGGVTKATGGMVSGLKAGAVAIGLVATAVGVASLKIAQSSSKMAMEVIESENLVAVTFGNLTGEIVSWSNELEEALGLNAFELRRNAGIFFNIANSMGVAQESAFGLSKGITSLANDMASFYNLDVEEAIIKLQAGLTGETEPLKRLGIIVDEATTKETAYRKGVAKTGEELTNAQKVIARYLSILDQTQNAQGDLARTIDSPANQLRILQNRIDSLKIALGNIFIPVISATLPYLVAFATALKEGVLWLTQLLGLTSLADSIKGMEGISDGIGGISDTANSATDSAKELKKQLAGFDELNVLQQPQAGTTRGGVEGGAGAFAFDLPEYDMGLENIKSDVNSLVDDMISTFKELSDSIIELLQPAIDLWENIVNPQLEATKALWGELTTSISNSPIGSILYGVAQVISVVLVGAFALLIGVINGVITLAVAYLNWWTERWYLVWNTVGDLIYRFWVFRDNVVRVFSDIRNFVVNVFSGIWNWISWVIDRIFDKIAGLRSGFVDFGYRIAIAIKGPINAVIDTINRFLNTIRGIKIPRIAPNGIQIPNIPRLANGGIVSSPTLAQIGEAGAEAVIPLENNTQWIDMLAERINGNGGNGTLIVKIGEETIFEKTVDYIKDKGIRTGDNLLSI